jgi:hypothetical protein
VAARISRCPKIEVATLLQKITGFADKLCSKMYKCRIITEKRVGMKTRVFGNLTRCIYTNGHLSTHSSSLQSSSMQVSAHSTVEIVTMPYFRRNFQCFGGNTLRLSVRVEGRTQDNYR